MTPQPTHEDLKAMGWDDFRVFLRALWSFLGLPPPTRIQLDIARDLQSAPRRRVIMAFRGAGKSWITCAYVLWLLIWNPQLRILIVSATETVAEDRTSFILRIIREWDAVEWLKPRRGQREAAGGFDVGPAAADPTPSVNARSITGQITGLRADIIVPDDVEIPENSFTYERRQKIANKTKEFAALLKPLPTSRIIYLGTPQVEDTLYRELESRGYVAQIWTSEVPKNPAVYANRLAPIIMRMVAQGLPAGSPTDPQRFDKATLLEALLEYKEKGYGLQFMLDTTLSDLERRPLRMNDLIVTDLDREMTAARYIWSRTEYIEGLEAIARDDRCVAPSWSSPEKVPYEPIVMAIDPSGRGRDDTSYAIAGGAVGYVCLLDQGGFSDGYSSSTLRGLALRAVEYRVNIIRIEEDFGDGMFTALFEPVLRQVVEEAAVKGYTGPVVEGYKAGRTQKEVRILDVLEPLTQTHRLVVDRGLIERDLKKAELLGPAKSWQYQLTHLTRERGCLEHDDAIEVIAEVSRPFVRDMRVDQDKAAQQRAEAALDAHLAGMRTKAFGFDPAEARDSRFDGAGDDVRF